MPESSPQLVRELRFLLRRSLFAPALALVCASGGCASSPAPEGDSDPMSSGGSAGNTSSSALSSGGHSATGGSGGTSSTATSSGTSDAGAGTGGSKAMGGGGGGVSTTVTAGDGAAPLGPYCTHADKSDSRAPGAPVLTPGVWKNITPPGVPVGAQYAGGQGFTFDPSHPSILYACFDTAGTGESGVFKSTDAGSNWVRLGTSDLDFPMHPRVDPKDSQHLYVGTGVRSKLQGFWVSHDGGASWVTPNGFKTWAGTTGTYDTYDIAVDPTDFDHVLVSFHSPWRSSPDSGVAESKDGGDTWISHPMSGTGAGNSTAFLFEPSLGIGNSGTWLGGTQGAGRWRTSDSGATWTKVSTTNMTHGGNQIYYAANNTIYSGGIPSMLKSSDNGVTWANVGPSGAYTSVFGDGNTMYSAPYYGPAPFLAAAESNDQAWAPYRDGAQKFVMGPFEQAFDAVNGILYSSTWQANLWALKVVCPQ